MYTFVPGGNSGNCLQCLKAVLTVHADGFDQGIKKYIFRGYPIPFQIGYELFRHLQPLCRRFRHSGIAHAQGKNLGSVFFDQRNDLIVPLFFCSDGIDQRNPTVHFQGFPQRLSPGAVQGQRFVHGFLHCPGQPDQMFNFIINKSPGIYIDIIRPMLCLFPGDILDIGCVLLLDCLFNGYPCRVNQLTDDNHDI